MNKKTIFIIVLLLLIVVLNFTGRAICVQVGFCKELPREAIPIVVWNLWDDEKSWEKMISSYEAAVAADKTRQPVKIYYYKKILSGDEDYENEFSKVLSEGKGPDIITINNSWMPRYKKMVAPLDDGARTAQSYQRKFVDVVSNDFLEDNKIYAVPLSLDTLALYYNIDMFSSVGITEPPKVWNDFSDDVKKLTMRDEKGNITRAGAAIGTDKNVNRSSDILSLLLLQSNSTIVGKVGDKVDKVATFTDVFSDGSNTIAPGEERTVGGIALQFYADFANPDKSVYTWNPLLDYSIDAFSQMNAAMMINYAYTVPVVRAKTPNLRFAIAPMPQIKGVDIPVNYASYWAMTVSSGSAHPLEAWDFLMYITNPEINKLYLTETGKPTAQRDLVAWQENGDDPNLAVFARQSLTAKSWYQQDNFAVDKIFNNAINSVIFRRATPEEASTTAAEELNKLMEGR